MSKKQKPPHDPFIIHEFLDRTTIMMETFDNVLASHVLCTKDEGIKKQVAKIEAELAKLYSRVNKVWDKNDAQLQN